MIAGEHIPRKLVALTDRRLKASLKEPYDALRGRLTDRHLIIASCCSFICVSTTYDALDEAVRIIDREAEAGSGALTNGSSPSPGFAT